jgi:hypothetical protein
VSLAAAGEEGMWESRSDFQALWEGRRAFHKAAFPPPLVIAA